jgi:hypothetical protein
MFIIFSDIKKPQEKNLHHKSTNETQQPWCKTTLFWARPSTSGPAPLVNA